VPREHSRPIPIEESPLVVEKGGIKVDIPWRFVLPIIGFLLGGGAIAGVTSMFGVTPSSADALSVFKAEQSVQHDDINKTLEAQDTRAKKQDERIADISKTVSSVQMTQQKDVARNEARRLTEKIPNRAEREETYDRLYELNLKHLQRGEDPCANVNCN
jgi:hypothetical protein